jgi:hypothetical protein
MVRLFTSATLLVGFPFAGNDQARYASCTCSKKH